MPKVAQWIVRLLALGQLALLVALVAGLLQLVPQQVARRLPARAVPPTPASNSRPPCSSTPKAKTRS